MSQPDDLPVTSPSRLAYRLREFFRLAGIGPTKGYAEVRAGRLRVRKIGRSSIVLAEDGAAYLAALPDGISSEPEAARTGREKRHWTTAGKEAPAPRHPLTQKYGVASPGRPEHTRQIPGSVARNGAGAGR